MLSSEKIISKAPVAWRYLNGIINVYKPSGVPAKYVQHTIITNICRDLNEMQVRPMKDMVKIEAADPERSKYVVTIEPNLADHELVVGQRYQIKDIKSVSSQYLGKFTSGVMVIGINKGIRTAHSLREANPIRVYHITGRLGRATETHFNGSPVTIRASFEHVQLGKLNWLLQSMQASHQKKMFEMCGVDMQSQTAFELAAQGPLRPSTKNVPLIYSLRCIDFNKPYFTIEVHAINETEAYLGILIHEIALQLKSVAHCAQVRCIRQSHFTLENTLIRRHWNLQSILSNMTYCKKVIHEHREILNPTNPTLEQTQ